MTKMQLFALSLLPAIPAGFLLVSLFGAVTSMGNFGVMVWVLWLGSLVAGLFVLGFSAGIFFLYRPAVAGAGAAVAIPEATPDATDEAVDTVKERVVDSDDDINDFDDAEDFADSDEMMETADIDDEFDDFDDDEDFV